MLPTIAITGDLDKGFLYAAGIEAAPDEQFIRLTQEFHKIPTDVEKVRFIFTNFEKWDGLLKPVTRKVNNRIYSFGFRITDPLKAEQLANHLINCSVVECTHRYFKAIDKVLKEAEDRTARLDYLDNYLTQHKLNAQGLCELNEHFKYGYDSERFRIKPFQYNDVLIAPPLPNHKLNFDVLTWLALGIGFYKVELFVRRRIDLQTDEKWPPVIVESASNIPLRRGGDQPTPYVFPAQQHETITEYDQVAAGPQPKFSLPDISLRNIFRSPDIFERMLSIMEEVGVTPELTTGYGGYLFGLIMAVKNSGRLLKKDYSDDALLQVFNSYLGTEFKQIKKTSKRYSETYDEAKRLINRNLPK